MLSRKEKIFVIGDIHGAYQALMQCFERSGFNYEKDRLIVLGDVCDGYGQVKECIDELLKVKQCDYIIGNHDLWALNWAMNGEKPEIWTIQGGEQTIASYKGGPMPPVHVHFLKNAHKWIVHENKLFVHGGINPDEKIETHHLDFLTWDRTLVETVWEKSRQDVHYKISAYDEIFIGHTTTQWLARNKNASVETDPLFLGNVVMLDTGAGWSGKLTIMDVQTHQYWQSDSTPKLYGISGRG